MGKRVKSVDNNYIKKAFIVSITGTPATGKSTLAKSLFNYFKDICKVKIIDQDELITKTDSVVDLDELRKTKVVNEIQICKRFLDAFKQDLSEYDLILIDSHLSHELPSNLIDLVIVTKCDTKTLYERLISRRYDELKIKENIEAEIFNICGLEGEEKGHNVVYYFSSNSEDTNELERVFKSKSLNEIIIIIKSNMRYG